MAISEKERSVLFATKRVQAQLNATTHVTDILWKTAENIVKAARKYRPYYQSKTMSNIEKYEKEALRIAAKSEKLIEKYVEAYSVASGKVLGIDAKELVGNYLNKKIFGKTYIERNSSYLEDFADDIISLVRAGLSLRYDEKKLIEAVRRSYKDPYNNSVMTKASREGKYAMTIPHRGQGVYAASYENIIRNVQNTINLSWGQVELSYGKINNYIGYFVHRGSSYPCDECQSQVGWMHSLKRMVVPIHANCKCFVTFARTENDNPISDM
nr:hypothetical protein [uncultured Prevotella sp.]